MVPPHERIEHYKVTTFFDGLITVVIVRFGGRTRTRLARQVHHRVEALPTVWGIGLRKGTVVGQRAGAKVVGPVVADAVEDRVQALGAIAERPAGVRRTLQIYAGQLPTGARPTLKPVWELGVKVSALG